MVKHNPTVISCSDYDNRRAAIYLNMVAPPTTQPALTVFNSAGDGCDRVFMSGMIQ